MSPDLQKQTERSSFGEKPRPLAAAALAVSSLTAIYFINKGYTPFDPFIMLTELTNR